MVAFFFIFFFAAYHDLVNSQAGGSMMLVSVTAQNAEHSGVRVLLYSQACIHVTDAAGSVSDHAQSDVLTEEARTLPLTLPSPLKLEAECSGACDRTLSL